MLIDLSGISESLILSQIKSEMSAAISLKTSTARRTKI